MLSIIAVRQHEFITGISRGLVTEKVWESESTDASEEEVDVSRKSSQNTNTSSPPVVQAKKKQSSLFRFIKNS